MVIFLYFTTETFGPADVIYHAFMAYIVCVKSFLNMYVQLFSGLISSFESKPQ